MEDVRILLDLDQVQWAMVAGAVLGTIYALGEGGMIPAWGADRNRPAIVKLLLLTIFVFLVGSEAETWRGWLLVVLCGVGAGKLADLLATAAIESWDALHHR